MMNKNLIGIGGIIVLLTGVALPFMGLQQGRGDILPLMMSGLCFMISGGLLVIAIRTKWFKLYALCSGGLVGIIFVLGFVAYFSGPNSKVSHTSLSRPKDVPKDYVVNEAENVVTEKDASAPDGASQ